MSGQGITKVILLTINALEINQIV